MINCIDENILTLTHGRNLLLITVNCQKPVNCLPSTVNRQNQHNLTVNGQSYTPIETLFNLFLRMDEGWVPLNPRSSKQLLWNSGGNYATQQVTMATQATGLPASSAPVNTDFSGQR